jgi:hypothetical protein
MVGTGAVGNGDGPRISRHRSVSSTRAYSTPTMHVNGTG